MDKNNSDSDIEVIKKRHINVEDKLVDNTLHMNKTKKPSKRTELRNKMWVDSESLVWQRKKHKGFTTIPKELPLIMNMVDHLAGGKMDLSRVYLGLWCNVWDDGFVKVDSIEKMAFEAGYISKKKTTEWRKRIDKLVELGFIEVKPSGTDQYGYILILDPIYTAKKLMIKAIEDKTIPIGLMNSFLEKQAYIN